MKIGIISDTHLGFGWNSERREDCFRNFEEALDLVKDVDAILMPGDIFDTKIPSQEVMSRTFKIFRKMNISSDALIQGKELNNGQVPIIAIHGTHERRGKKSVNPVELLEDSGFLIHLHNDSVFLEKEGERVHVAGMSGVPERYAPKVLKRWAPRPEGDYSIFMFHQSVEGFVYTDGERDVLDLSDMPEGFDILVDGHIHWKNLDLRAKDVPLVFPGSTITTQMNKKEMESRKGVLVVDTETDSVEFRALENNRKVYRLELDATGLGENEIVDKAVSMIEEKVNSDGSKKPLLRLKITGKTDSTVKKSDIKRRIDSVVLKIGDSTKSIEKKGEKVEMGEEDIEEVGKSMLNEDISFEGFDELFEKLVEGDTEGVLETFRKLDEEDIDSFLEENDKEKKEESSREVFDKASENKEEKDRPSRFREGNLLDHV